MCACGGQLQRGFAVWRLPACAFHPTKTQRGPGIRHCNARLDVDFHAALAGCHEMLARPGLGGLQCRCLSDKRHSDRSFVDPDRIALALGCADEEAIVSPQDGVLGARF
jgi:hypothetical protein